MHRGCSAGWHSISRGDTLSGVNHPIAPPAKRRVVHPTAAEVRRADRVATRPDGTIDPSLFALAIARPLHLEEDLARQTVADVKARKNGPAPRSRVKKEG